MEHDYILDYNQDESGYVYGLEYTGISVTKDPTGDKIRIVAHLHYDFKHLAKMAGYKWDRKSWCIDVPTMSDAVQAVKETLDNPALRTALHEGGEYEGSGSEIRQQIINCFVLPSWRKQFKQLWESPNSGNEKKAEKPQYKMSLGQKKADIYLLIKSPYDEGLISDIKSLNLKAQWNPDKKFWAIPVGALDLLNSSKKDSIEKILNRIEYFSPKLLEMYPVLQNREN